MAKKRNLQWLITAPEKLNLAEELEVEELGRLGSDVVQTYELDLNDREDWSKLSESALKLAKLVKEPKTTPWENCSNVKHPLITSATIQFAARAYPEVCKGNKIVKCQITGDNPKNIPTASATQTPNLLSMAGPSPPQGTETANLPPGIPEMPGMVPPTGPSNEAVGVPPQTQGLPSGMPPEMMQQMMAMQGQPGQQPQQSGPSPEELAKNAKQDRASRISEHMNWQLTQEMVEWEEQMDRLLHVLPVIGQCYKKTYFSSIDGRNVSELVLPDDCVVNAGAKSIKTARRITHRLRIYANEVWEKVNSGVWLDVNLGSVGDKPEDIDSPHEFLEQHTYADLDGDDYKEPYIVTVHKQSGQVVRVVARWQPDAVMPSDKKMKVGKIVPDEYFTHFGFIPNPDGSLNYLGFGQLLEPLNASVNTALNQLLDAGSLYNSGGGFIGRGVRMKGGSINLKLGEWKFIDAPGANIKDNLVPLPVREPSQTLFQLLGFLVQAGKEISSVQDILTGDANLAASMPVGTAMAMVEQGLKVFTAIYKRVYRSLSEEFKKLYNLNARYLEPDFTFYISGREDQYQIGQRDYLTGDTTVVPVADPDLSSDMQRLLKAQALKDLSGRPGLNEVEVTRRLVRAVRPEDMDTVLMTDKQISGKEPMSWSPPPQPQMVVAQAKAEHLKARAQEAIVRLQMDMSKHSLEIESLLADIGKKKADAILSLAKAEAAEAGPQLQQYQAELNMITSQAKMQTDVMKEKIKAMAGQAGMAGQPGQPQQPALPEPEQDESPIEGMAEGGPVSAGLPYLVGEAGPEVIVPNQPGTVIPNQGGGGGPTEAANPTVSSGMTGQSGSSRISVSVPDTLKDIWQSSRDKMIGGAQSIDEALAWPFASVAGPGVAETATKVLFPETPQEAMVGGIAGLAPAVVKANFRSPEVIKGLRKAMAEENRARGPVNQTWDKFKTPMSPSDWERTWHNDPSEYLSVVQGTNRGKTNLIATPDPIEQILRGAWYHGLSDKARSTYNPKGVAYQDVFPIEKGIPRAPQTYEPGHGFISKAEYMPEEMERYIDNLSDKLRIEQKDLYRASKYGLPISHHDAQSMSGGKLGEPSGVSLTMLPPKGAGFAADEYVHRVQPQYGGPPKERVVDLMTAEGRSTLQDAYDVVANKLFRDKTDLAVKGQVRSPMENLAELLNIKVNIENENFAELFPNIGRFNQALSQELQRRGKRAILYNPQRWNEYEMLMLDPKYALPLDYRKASEYVPQKIKKQAYGETGFYSPEELINKPGPGSATPGVRKGLAAIQDEMAKNKSRLGDIYAERPWTQRLSDENKQRLLDLIDPQYRKDVAKQLGMDIEKRQGGGPVQAGQPYLVGEQGPEVVVPTQPATVFPNQDPFGPEYYDMASAQNYGLKPDQTGHWPSRVPQGPQVGLILKSEQHPTFWKTMAADRDAGYNFYRNVHDGRVYSFPANETVPPDYYPYEEVQ